MSARRTWSEEDFKNAVKESVSVAQVLKKLGLRPVGGNYQTVKRYVSHFGLDTTHFTGQATYRGGQPPQILEDILVENSSYTNTARLKERLFTEGLLTRKCVSCGLDSWLGKPIPLELDHINGNREDNRLINLRILCPNCHAGTLTYRRRK